MKQHIYLIGFMGTGKTTISHKLRELTGAKEIDMDAWIVEKNTLSINEMFEKYGETYFRDRETDAVCEIAKSAPAIVSCGGGAVLRQENTQMMKESGRIVLLTATPETVYQRVKNSTDRPLLNGHMNVEYIASLMENVGHCMREPVTSVCQQMEKHRSRLQWKFWRRPAKCEHKIRERFTGI